MKQFEINEEPAEAAEEVLWSNFQYSIEITTLPKKMKKRPRNENKWKKVKAKILRNAVKEYKTKTGKEVKACQIKTTCTDKCKLLCKNKISESQRAKIFQNFWELGSLQRQRDFLGTCIEKLVLKFCQISSIVTSRKPNCCYFFIIDGEKIRVCKTFLINTLGITERMVRTVTTKKIHGNGISPKDGRGKHNNHRMLSKN